MLHYNNTMTTGNDEKTLTHFNADGDVHMVDVGAKQASQRRAIAEGRINSPGTASDSQTQPTVVTN